MTSGRTRRSFAVERLLLFEVAVLDHAGQLDDAFELQLAPAAADTRTLERIDQPSRFGLQVFANRIERRDTLQQARAVLHAPALRILDLAVHTFERVRHRGEQIVDRLLARVDIGRGLGARLFEPRLGEMEERFVVLVEGLGAQRGKGIAEPGFSVRVGFQPFRVNGPIRFQLRPHSGEDRASGEPRCDARPR